MSQVKIPPWVEIKPSSIPGAGLGAFARVAIDQRRRLGEYLGRRLTPKEYDRLGDHTYVWELKQHHVPILYLDGKERRHSNWTRYVNCPSTRDEENVVAMQINLKMVYYSKRPILAGEELLVWYGSAYAEHLFGKGGPG